MAPLEVYALLAAGDDVPELTLARPPWMADAACAEYESAVWFPGGFDDDSAAKAVCAACLVRAECLAYAMNDPTLDGVWGGLSALERRRARRAVTSSGKRRPAA